MRLVRIPDWGPKSRTRIRALFLVSLKHWSISKYGTREQCSKSQRSGLGISKFVSVDAHRNAAVAGAYERGEWVSGNTAMKHLFLNVLALVES